MAVLIYIQGQQKCRDDVNVSVGKAQVLTVKHQRFNSIWLAQFQSPLQLGAIVCCSKTFASPVKKGQNMMIDTRVYCINWLTYTAV